MFLEGIHLPKVNVEIIPENSGNIKYANSVPYTCLIPLQNLLIF
jgi:hypothetical protein